MEPIAKQAPDNSVVLADHMIELRVTLGAQDSRAFVAGNVCSRVFLGEVPLTLQASLGGHIIISCR
jgi:hypothetical protein